MTIRWMAPALALALLGVGLGAPALPQPLHVQAPPVGFKGSLVAYTEDSVTLAAADGKETVVAMTPAWTVSKPRTLPASAIKPDDFVASANQVVDERTGRATELRIMEPGYRPEYGTHLMAQSGNAMTHGTVARVSRGDAGIEVDVSYPGGGRRLILSNDMTIIDYVAYGREVLVPGTKVSAVARRGDDGVLRAGRLTLD